MGRISRLMATNPTEMKNISVTKIVCYILSFSGGLMLFAYFADTPEIIISKSKIFLGCVLCSVILIIFDINKNEK
jgi:hypothetical protein